MLINKYLLIFCIIVGIKIVALTMLHLSDIRAIGGGGNDSDYYHSYALGETEDLANIWPQILRLLNEYNFYSRDAVSFFIKFLSVIAIPVTAALALKPKSFQSIAWKCAIVISLYPSLFFISLDIYRDALMIYIWMVCVLLFQIIQDKSSSSFARIILVIMFLFLSVFLIKLRPYLGVALILGLFSYRLFDISKRRFIFYIFIYLITLTLMYHYGLLGPLMSYREIFDTRLTGGSNLGISFGSTLTFLPTFGLSTIRQFFGLFFVNTSALIVFLIESVPIIIFTIYIYLNRAYTTKFINFLVAFSIIYGSIWILANDNLGTATRLRIYNYLAIAICFFSILISKKYSYRSKKNENTICNNSIR